MDSAGPGCGASWTVLALDVMWTVLALDVDVNWTVLALDVV